MAKSGCTFDQDHILARFLRSLNLNIDFGTGLCLKSGLLTPYVAIPGRLQKFGPFHQPPLGLFQHGKYNK